MLADPLTGEIVPDELDALDEVEQRADAWLRGEYAKLRKLREMRDRLRERIAEIRGPATLPRPLHRTHTQQRVAECPRCGAHEG